MAASPSLIGIVVIIAHVLSFYYANPFLAMTTENKTYRNHLGTDITSPVPITVAIVNYNGSRFIRRCMDALYETDYPNLEVMVIDNASTDDSVSLIRRYYPQVTLHRMPANKGPNPARNYALKHAGTRYVLLMDNDAFLTPTCLRRLVSSIRSDGNTVIYAPKIVSCDAPEQVQYFLTSIHFLGQAIIDTRVSNTPMAAENTLLSTTVNGTTLLIDRQLANSVALFDEEMFFGWTDGDYSFRITAAGLKCLVVTDAVVLHPIKVRSRQIVYHQVKNRWIFMLKNISCKTLLLIAPSLVVYEIMLAVFLFFRGDFKVYIQAIMDIVREMPSVKRRRIIAMKHKKKGDQALLSSGDFVSAQMLITNNALKLVLSIINRIFDIYWMFVRPMVR